MNHKPCYLPNSIMDEYLFSALIPVLNENRLVSYGFCNSMAFEKTIAENQKSENAYRLIEELTRPY